MGSSPPASSPYYLFWRVIIYCSWLHSVRCRSDQTDDLEACCCARHSTIVFIHSFTRGRLQCQNTQKAIHLHKHTMRSILCYSVSHTPCLYYVHTHPFLVLHITHWTEPIWGTLATTSHYISSFPAVFSTDHIAVLSVNQDLILVTRLDPPTLNSMWYNV